MQESQTIQCPNCQKPAKLVQYLQEIPHFGKLLFSTLSCENSVFKLSDVFCTEFKKPVQYSACIDSEKDLSLKIVKSSTATVEIPELGVLVEPGAASEGYFSNIEGFLDRVQQVAQILVDSAKNPEEINAARKSLEKIKKAREGNLAFSIIVKDPFGNSALLGDNVERKELSEKEAASLKKPFLVLEKS